jgi:hypothetical protein
MSIGSCVPLSTHYTRSNAAKGCAVLYAPLRSTLPTARHRCRLCFLRASDMQIYFMRSVYKTSRARTQMFLSWNYLKKMKSYSVSRSFLQKTQSSTGKITSKVPCFPCDAEYLNLLFLT